MSPAYRSPPSNRGRLYQSRSTSDSAGKPLPLRGFSSAQSSRPGQLSRVDNAAITRGVALGVQGFLQNAGTGAHLPDAATSFRPMKRFRLDPSHPVATQRTEAQDTVTNTNETAGLNHILSPLQSQDITCYSTQPMSDFKLPIANGQPELHAKDIQGDYVDEEKEADDDEWEEIAIDACVAAASDVDEDFVVVQLCATSP